eukprot:TRINITY_DN22637_c0_g1_i1.p1 TRINITY_DN22637_c0_g1~~TRINITY_DN22637_c0_g1_i1.p1  ORF type:complete len:255 (+),score=31.67 TRINITY_DN22637_c0_g1_i1:48-812(+)
MVGVRSSLGLVRRSCEKRLCSFKRTLSTSKYVEPFTLSPAAPRKLMGSIIWVHGIEKPHSDFLELSFLSLKPKYFRLVLPMAPSNSLSTQQLASSRTWFDANNIAKAPEEVEQERDEHGIADSVAFIHSLLDAESKLTQPESIILGGHGQGAALALLSGLTYGHKLSGIVSASGYVPRSRLLESPGVSAANRSTPVLALHGADDSLIPEAVARAAYDELRRRGVSVDLQVEQNCGHVLSQKQRDMLAVFFGSYY